jgi:general secretion pathway protein K
MARVLRIGQTAVSVRIENETDRIDLNAAPAALLHALIVEVGTAPAEADRLTAAILDWRTPGAKARDGGAKASQYQAAGLAYAPPGEPFQSVGELADVLGMSPALLQRLAPHVTVLTNSDPDMTTRDAVVSRALTDAAGVAGGTAGALDSADQVLRITVTAIGQESARYGAMVVASADFHGKSPRVDVLFRQRLDAAPVATAVAANF